MFNLIMTKKKKKTKVFYNKKDKKQIKQKLGYITAFF